MELDSLLSTGDILPEDYDTFKELQEEVLDTTQVVVSFMSAAIQKGEVYLDFWEGKQMYYKKVSP